MLTRRKFLRTLGTAAFAGVVATPALAELLTPKPTIFLPPRGGWFTAKTDFCYGLTSGSAFNGAIPSFLTTYIDPEIIEVLLTPRHFERFKALAAEFEGYNPSKTFAPEYTWSRRAPLVKST